MVLHFTIADVNRIGFRTVASVLTGNHLEGDEK